MTKKRSNQLALPGVGRRGRAKVARVVRKRVKVVPATPVPKLASLPAKYQAARQALAAAHRVDEVKSIRDKAVAMEVYARQAKDTELIAHATEIRKRAERRLGELMASQPKAKGTRGAGRPPKGGSPKDPPKDAPALFDLGIDKHLADRARKAAAMPEAKFEAEVAKSVKVAVAATEGDREVVRAAREEQQQEKKERRDEREQDLAKSIIALPDKKYGVILADPEWQFEPYSRETGMDRAADNHYDTSPLDEIKKRDVPSIAADDSVLFLWATVPMLPQALIVMDAWGFDYKSQAIWVKDRQGTGYWFRNRHELLLVGTRRDGNLPAPAPGTQFESVFVAPVGAHSGKPDKAYEIIESYFPNLPRIELNARRARAGWDSWGREAPPQAQAAE